MFVTKLLSDIIAPTSAKTLKDIVEDNLKLLKIIFNDSEQSTIDTINNIIISSKQKMNSIQSMNIEKMKDTLNQQLNYISNSVMNKFNEIKEAMVETNNNIINSFKSSIKNSIQQIFSRTSKPSKDDQLLCPLRKLIQE